MAFLGLATSKELSGTAGVAKDSAGRINVLEKRVDRIEKGGITQDMFKGINESILSINRNLLNIQEAIVADTDLEKQQARDQAKADKDKLDLQKKERAESFLELDAKKTLMKPVEKATEGVKSVFQRFFDALGALVGGWFIDKFGDLYEGWKDGDNKKLEEAAGQIKAGLGILAGVFVAQQVGTVLLSTAMGGLMGAITGGGGIGSVLSLLGNPVAWLAIGAVITAIAVWARNREMKKNDRQKLEQLLIQRELSGPVSETEKTIIRNQLEDNHVVNQALIQSESGVLSETNIGFSPTGSSETNLNLGSVNPTGSTDSLAKFLLLENKIRKSVNIDGMLFDDAQWDEFPELIAQGVISKEEAVLHMAIKEGLYSSPATAYVARYYQELSKWVQINDRIKEISTKLKSAKPEEAGKLTTELASLKVLLDQTNNTIVTLEGHADETTVKPLMMATYDLAAKEMGLDPKAAKELMEAGGDRKKMLEILTRFGEKDYFSEQTGGIISGNMSGGWMNRAIAAHEGTTWVDQNILGFGGREIPIGLDDLSNWEVVMKDLNQHTTYLPKGMEAGFTPYTPGSTSSITSNNDLSSFNYDSSYWNMDNMPKFEFVYPQNLGEQFKNTDLYTGTLSGVPSLWTINLEDGLGTYYTTEYGVD
tara:strand:+ start:1173 stop:3122 length:1950 start_codon:yes stop_codon:yes gene_type:complete